MIEGFLYSIELIDDLFWSYIGIPAILILGTYISFKFGWFQIKYFPLIMKNFFGYLFHKPVHHERGVAPLQAFFASVSGCIGIGNIVGVCTAVQIGGPGAVFWMWVTALVGMVIKYAEVYLGLKFRIKNKDNSYDGGPMYFLQKISKNVWLPRIFCIFMCIYGVEIYMFRIITRSISYTWNINYCWTTLFLLAATLIIGQGGVRLVGKVSSILIPLFISFFVFVSLYIFSLYSSEIPGMLQTIITSAFSGHAAAGAFAGSSIILTMSNGMKRAAYTGDIGVGYASIIHSESEETHPTKQASLSIVGIFIDTFVICTISVFLILLTGTWNAGYHESVVLAEAIRPFIPGIIYIWPIFLFLLGYSSLIAFFAAGRKAAIFLSKKYGVKLYFLYAFCAFLFFSYYGEERHSLMIMSIAAICLLIINLIALIFLQKEIEFDKKSLVTNASRCDP